MIFSSSPFLLPVHFLCGNILFCFFKCNSFFSNFFSSIFNMFFSKLYFQLLHFNFFIDCFKFTVVFYIVTLLFIFFYQCLCFFDSFFPLLNKFSNTIDLFFNTCLACMQTQ